MFVTSLKVNGCTELGSASISTINNATINDPKLSNISTQSSPATNILALDSDGRLHTACSVCCKMCNCRGQARLATFDLRGFDWRLTDGVCLLSQASLQVSCHNFSSGCVDDPYRITIQTCCETNYPSNKKDWSCNCVALNNYAVCILARCDINSQNAHSLCSYIIVSPDKICLCNMTNPAVTGSDLEICRNCITFRTGGLFSKGSTFTFRDGSLQLLNNVRIIDFDSSNCNHSFLDLVHYLCTEKLISAVAYYCFSKGQEYYASIGIFGAFWGDSEYTSSMYCCSQISSISLCRGCKNAAAGGYYYYPVVTICGICHGFDFRFCIGDGDYYNSCTRRFHLMGLAFSNS